MTTSAPKDLVDRGPVPNGAVAAAGGDDPERRRVGIFIDWPNLDHWLRDHRQSLDLDTFVAHLRSRYRPLRITFYVQEVAPSGLGRLDVKVRIRPPVRTEDGQTVHKDVDPMIIADLLMAGSRMETVVLFSGDDDFWYALNPLADLGVRIELVGPNGRTSARLRLLADHTGDYRALPGLAALKPPAPALPEPQRARPAALAGPAQPSPSPAPAGGERALAKAYEARLAAGGLLLVPAPRRRRTLQAVVEALRAAPGQHLRSPAEADRRALEILAREGPQLSATKALQDARATRHAMDVAGDCFALYHGTGGITLAVGLDAALAIERTERGLIRRLATALKAMPDAAAVTVLLHGPQASPALAQEVRALVGELEESSVGQTSADAA